MKLSEKQSGILSELARVNVRDQRPQSKR